MTIQASAPSPFSKKLTAIKYRRKFWSAQSIGNMLGFSHETVRSFLISVGEWK